MTHGERIAWAIEERSSALADLRNSRGETPEAIALYAGGFREAAKIARETPEPSPWIGVDDRLPEPKQYVLGHRDGDMWVVAFWNGNWWTDPQTDHCDVTHWMPLPPLP